MELTTLLFLGLAVLIIFKLRSVLGRRTGTERPPMLRRDAAPGAPNDNVVPLPQRPGRPAENGGPVPPEAGDRRPPALPAGPVGAALQTVMRADPGFDAGHFLSGAKAAYEMIVNAFAQGDRQALRPLLAREVFDGFDAAITARERAGNKVESTFVGIDSADIVEAAMRGTNAQIGVRFVSKLIQATRGPDGAVLDGDPQRVTEVTDAWTFSRDVSSRDPNWRLVATEAAA